MATVTEMREWLRGQGEDVPARGRLRPELVDKYEAAHADTDWDLADLDAEFADPDELEPSVPLQPERPPRTQRAARAERRAQPVTKRASSVLGKLLGEDKKANAAKSGKKKIPRTSLERLISRSYSEVGKLLGVFSQPMSRCIQAQATFAGIVWEDIARDTIVDRALQPVARAEEKLDKMFALTVTPLAVLAVERNMLALQQQVITPQQFAVRQALTMPVLKEGLRKQLEISEQYADQIKAKLERDAHWDEEIDKMLFVIFGEPEAAPEPEREMAGAAA